MATDPFRRGRAGPHLRQIVHWDRIGTLLSNPAELFREVYGWGTSQFDAAPLVAGLGGILQFAGVDTMMRQLPARAEGMISGRALTDPLSRLLVPDELWVLARR